MWPTLYEIHTADGSVGFHTYGMFIVAAFSAAFLLVHTRAHRVGLHPDRMIATYLGAAVGGLLGGRLLYAFAVDYERTFSDPMSLFSFSGFAFYGGVLGGAVGVGVVAAFMKLNAWKVADLAAPAVVLGLGVGRMGCFFAGCCHGAVAPVGEHLTGLLPAWFTGGQLWWSGQFPFLTAEFHGGVGRLLDVPLYPTQLWSAVTGVSLSLFLAWLWKHRRFDGQIGALALVIEPPTRILIEGFRADHRGVAVDFPVSDVVASWLPGMNQAGSELGASVGLTTSQAIGLGMMVLGLVLLAVRQGAGREPEVKDLPTDELSEELFEG